jgi:MYXO-CTERM domain-containing protein
MLAGVALGLVPGGAALAAPGYQSCGTDCYQADTVSVADVQAAIDAADADNGGTVRIPAGTGDFASAVEKAVTRDLVITGAGAGCTIINATNADAPTVFSLSADGQVRLELRSMRINQAFDGVNSPGCVGVSGTSFRKVVADITFDQTGMEGGRMLIVGSPNDAANGGGVIYGCTFFHPGAAAQSMSVEGPLLGPAQGPWHWDGMPDWGSGDKWYIEDNTFEFTSGEGDGALDAYDGAKLVFRHNAVDGTEVGWHGYDSDVLSAHSGEIYQNTFTWPPNLLPDVHPAFALNIRGGTALIWGNTFDAAYPDGFTLSYYRSAEDLGFVAAKCDGTCPVDQNSDATGYRCQQQPGSTGDDGLTQAPVMAWNNLAGGAPMGFGLNGNFMPPIYSATPNETDHIKEERDYLGDTTCSDGVDNDGNGSSDAADAVCSTFWDEANHQALGYVPYTYPHPLRTDGQAGSGGDLGCGGAGVGANGAAGGADEEDSGCGCRMGSRGAQRAHWLPLAALLAAGLRRRRRSGRAPRPGQLPAKRRERNRAGFSRRARTR